MNPANFPTRKERKRAEAKVRQEAASKLTPQEKLERLDQTFGVGMGATKERAKLAKRLTRTPVLVAPGEVLFVEPSEPGQAPKPGKPKRKQRNEKRGNAER